MNNNTHTHTVHNERDAWFVLATAVKPGAWVTVATHDGEVSGPIGYHTGGRCGELFLMNGPAIPLVSILSITHNI